MIKYWLTLAALFPGVACGDRPLPAPESPPKPAAVRQFEADVEKLREDFQAEQRLHKKQYTARYAEIQDTLIRKLEVELDNRTRAADLDGAIELRGRIAEMKTLSQEPPRDDPEDLVRQLRETRRELAALKAAEPKPRPLRVNSRWEFLGINRQWINSFTFMSDGSVMPAQHYNQATWRRISANAILFNYGPGQGYILFEPESGNVWKGFGSRHGKVRYLKKKP